MQCLKPFRLKGKNALPGFQARFPDGLLVPCGKCVMCRIAKRREWTLRLIHESMYWEDSVFLTLTYDDEHVPEDFSLKKRDLQLFIKRLRRRLNDRKIRYFACGEYGDESQRPHYHAIVFGLSLHEEDKQAVKDSWTYCDWSNSSIAKNSFGLAEPDSMRYVAQYIDKKFTGPLAEEEYDQKGREPVFRLLSLGLGAQFCDDNSERIIEQKRLTINGKDVSIPRYYLKRLGLSGEEFAEQAEQRELEEVERFSGLHNTDDELYKALEPADYMEYYQRLKNAKKQKDKNVNAKFNLRHSKL